LRAGYAFPLRSGSEIIGVIEFFSRRLCSSDTGLMSMMAALGSQLGQYLERKRAEDERDRFFNLSLNMLCIIGFDGYFKRLSPAWEATLGFTTEELLGAACLDFIHPDDRTATRAEAERAMSGHATVAFENRYRCRDGSYRWLLWNAVPFPEEQVLYAVASDITERKELEESHRRYAEERERTARLASIGMLSAGVAHEINNPLAFVGTNLAVLERDCLGLLALVDVYQAAGEGFARAEPKLAEQAAALAEEMDLAYVRGNLQRLLTRTRDGVERVSRIVHSLRNLARTEVPRPQETNIPGLVENSLEMIRGQLKRSGVVVEEDYGPSPQVACVSTQIGQVLLNLLVNALHAIEAAHRPGGRIRARTYRRDGFFVIEVADNGCGIDPQHLPRLFDPFFTTKNVGEGMGLGLSISHNIVAAHNGRIEVESRPGQGTCFRVLLPLDSPTP
jgi:PAS domain S-box-containing protein